MGIKKNKRWKKWFLKDNLNVPFVFKDTTKMESIVNDITFIMFFLFIPYFLSFTNDMFPNGEATLKYLIVTLIKSVMYVIGYLSIKKNRRIWLAKNGGNAFFIGIFFTDLVIPLIFYFTSSFVSASALNSLTTIISGSSRIIVIVLVFVMATPLRKSIKYALLRKLPLVIGFAIIGYIVILNLNPLFQIISKSINGGTTPANQQGIDVTLNQKDFETYLLIIFVAVLAPIYEEIVYRHSLMIIVDNKVLKFLVPFFHFAAIHVIQTYRQDFSHIFDYLLASFVFTTIMYIKRNVTYPMAIHALSNQITLLFS